MNVPVGLSLILRLQHLSCIIQKKDRKLAFFSFTFLRVLTTVFVTSHPHSVSDIGTWTTFLYPLTHGREKHVCPSLSDFKFKTQDTTTNNTALFWVTTPYNMAVCSNISEERTASITRVNQKRTPWIFTAVETSNLPGWPSRNALHCFTVGSNLRRDNDYPDVFSWLSSEHPRKCQYSTSTRPQPQVILQSPFWIHHSTMALAFDAI
jgi:hypothetical protein